VFEIHLCHQAIELPQDAYQKMVELTGCNYESPPSAEDVCQDCVLLEFQGIRRCSLSTSSLPYYCLKGRLYNLEHPKLVKEFDEVSELKGDARGYWISKKWLKGQRYCYEVVHQLTFVDWRLSKPKMHRASVDDPAPDSLEYREHVLCEHGVLASNSLNRRVISEQVRWL
jgi:hypothetical protein